MEHRKISFHYQTRIFSFRDRRNVKDLLVTLFRKEGIEFQELTYIFCTDAYLLRINKEFLRHNTLTDVITFQYSEIGAPVVSEIYISVERIKENATEFGLAFSQELVRVMIHGALHLCGYSDKTLSSKKTMSLKEDEYLRLHLVPRETD